MHDLLKQLKGTLIVSCQALPEEPLHSPTIMGKMALAAHEGGASGIRANSPADILEIKKQVSLPVIGIIKSVHADSDVFITPTLADVKELVAVDVDIIAMDATSRKRPGKRSLQEIVEETRLLSPNTLLMADVSTFDEALQAEKLGFDCVATTLAGYTKETKGRPVSANEFSLLKELVSALSIPVVAEGGINTPAMAKKALKSGAHFVVVGSAITRPQLITKSFVNEIES